MTGEDGMEAAVAASLAESAPHRQKRPVPEAMREEISWSLSVGGEECCICCMELEADQESRVLSCGHEHHHECLILWLDEQNFCPVCRY